MPLSLLLLALVLGLCLDCLRTGPAPADRREWAALLFLVLAAVLLRAVWLAQSSLEHLEATYLFEAIKPATLLDVVGSRQASEQMHQPLYPLLLRGWAGIPGVPGPPNEAWLRLPSVVFSALVVPLTWALARPSLGRSTALWAAAFVAANPLLVWYGRDASPYALLAVLTAAAALSAHRQRLAASPAPAGPPAPSIWGAVRTAILLSLGFYTHYHGAWATLAVGGYLLLTVPRLKSTRITVGVTALLCLPWLPMLLHALTTSVGGLVEDQPLVVHSHELGEATAEALRVLVGGPGARFGLSLAAIAWGAARLVRQKSPLVLLIACGVGFALAAEAHILWQLSRSKGIVYVDVRHYVWLVPLLALAAARLPRHLAVVPVALGLWTSVGLVDLDKPDVRGAAAWVRTHATGPEHGVSYLPAPWYEPILETYLFGGCSRLTHARSREGWWRRVDCFFHEAPVDDAIYGFPPNPQRLHQAANRRTLRWLWLVDIRDHRFGLPVPPSVPQAQHHCWEGAREALVRERTFGAWVTVRVYDAGTLRTVPPPPPPDTTLRTVRAADAWPPPCP